MRRPWLKFYPSDWRAEPRLRMCSLAAHGLWIDLISYMHEGEPYGHLSIATDTLAIAGLVGRPRDEVESALAELDARGVLSRTDEGVIFSRRMVRDRAKEDADVQNGKRGGNPRLMGWVNPPDKAQMPDARRQSPDKDQPRAVAEATRAAVEQLFDEFWIEKPERRGANPKGPALKCFMVAIATGRKHEVDVGLARTIIAAVKRYAAELRAQGKIGTEFVAQAVTWLRQQRWKDYPEKPASADPIIVGKYYAKPESAQLEAWDRWSIATRGHRLPRDKGGGWWVDSEQPPAASEAA